MEINRLAIGLLTTKDITLLSSLAAFYIVSTFLPVDVFLGGAGIITLEIVTVPIIADILRTLPAAICISIGSLGMALFGTGVYPFFGFLSILIPVISTIQGSVAFHNRLGSLVPWTYVILGSLYYLKFSRGGTLLWLIPYAIVVFSVPLTFRVSGPRRIVLLSFYTAMSWQVTLNILSISVAGLTNGFWIGVTPFMFFERSLATFASASIIIALKSRLGIGLGLGQAMAEVT